MEFWKGSLQDKSKQDTSEQGCSPVPSSQNQKGLGSRLLSGNLIYVFLLPGAELEGRLVVETWTCVQLIIWLLAEVGVVIKCCFKHADLLTGNCSNQVAIALPSMIIVTVTCLLCSTQSHWDSSECIWRTLWMFPHCTESLALEKKKKKHRRLTGPKMGHRSCMDLGITAHIFTVYVTAFVYSISLHKIAQKFTYNAWPINNTWILDFHPLFGRIMNFNCDVIHVLLERLTGKGM